MFYLREGANCQKMSREQIRDFFYKEGALYFDSQINGAFDLQKDMEARHYTRFAEAAGIPADMETGDALRNIGLLKREGLTNAGVLLLCGNAVPFFPSATVTCALFQGTTKTKILDTKIYGEDIASNYQKALVYLKSHLNTEFIITGKRENKLELPEEALREALMNALTHRDYRSSADVQVSIFSNRVEIVNPGGLVGGLHLEDLGKRSIPRNPLLFGTLFRMRLVEHVSSGIKRIRDALTAENHPVPLIEADERWFSVTFRRKEATSEKTSEKGSQKSSQKSSQKIIAYMQKEPEITIEELSIRIGISDRAVKKHIAKLQEIGKLKRIGPDKGGHWEVLD
jgi:ATP-dependent DNA helicase RecG